MPIHNKANVKFNNGRGALLCEWCDIIIRSDFDPSTIEDKYHYCGGDYCKKQDNCKHGFVFPDRCRYNNRLGCDCGAYQGTLGPDFFLDNTQMCDCNRPDCAPCNLDVSEYQATFKDHCQWPKCDCDRVAKCIDIMDALDGPEQECHPLSDYDKAETNPAHGGKIWEA